MDAKELLVCARILIGRPERWTQGVYARTKNGRRTEVDSPHARCWCAFGALRAMQRATGSSDQSLDAAWRAIEGATDGFSVVAFNDSPSRTHAEVLAAFDRAIETVTP